MRDFRIDELELLGAMVMLTQPTRLALAEKTRFSVAKLSKLLSGLERINAIRKRGKTESKGGRPSAVYQPHTDLGCVLGIAIHQTRLSLVVIDAAGESIYEREAPLALSADLKSHFQGILSATADEARSVLRELEGTHRFLCVGLALPGILDTAQGLWLQGLQMSGIHHVNPAQELEKRLGLPVFQEDITRSLAYFEMMRGCGRDLPSFILVHVDMGLGTAIVNDHEVYRGIHGIAGELGHLSHPGSAYRCSCNRVGCLETIVSTPGILRIFEERLNEGVHSILRYRKGGDAALRLQDIHDAARSDDRFARTTLDEIGRFIGDSCAILIKLLNPGRIIISGPVCMFKDFFREAIHQELKHQVFQEMLEDFEMLFADYRTNQEAHGVAIFALEGYLRRRITEKRGHAGRTARTP